jgi:hypothetical protein
MGRHQSATKAMSAPFAPRASLRLKAGLLIFSAARHPAEATCMGMQNITFVKDLPKIQRYIDKCALAQQKIDDPITAIEFGMKLCQAGHLVLNFDVRVKHERDGEWTRSLDGPTLSMQHWSMAYMNAAEYGIEFVRLSGEKKFVAPGAGDAAVAGEFGKTLLSIIRDAKARDIFTPLRLAQECQVEILEFDWMWQWPTEQAELGKRNLFRKLRAKRLPRTLNA